MRTSEADLIEAAKAGDRDALDRLLRQHEQQLHALCRRMMGNPTDALDALQEAMIAVVRGLPRFDGRSKLSTWMHRVATNACLDELRRRKRRPTDVLPEVEHPVAGGEPGLADTVTSRVAIDAALGALPVEFRAPLVLRDVLGHDYATIAEILDIPPGTVRSRIARARAAVAAALEDDGNQTHRSGRQTTTKPDDSPSPA